MANTQVRNQTRLGYVRNKWPFIYTLARNNEIPHLAKHPESVSAVAPHTFRSVWFAHGIVDDQLSICQARLWLKPIARPLADKRNLRPKLVNVLLLLQ